MKQKQRYRRKTKGGGLVDLWPAWAPSPEDLASRVRYVGSAEHKARPVPPSFIAVAGLRSDASKCPSSVSREQAQRLLSEAVLRRCVSQDFDSIFPRYAWGRMGGVPYVARLINTALGDYKGWPIEELEFPLDREKRLAWDLALEEGTDA